MVSVRFGVKSDVKGGNGLDPLSFSSRLLSLVYRIQQRKEGRGGEKDAVCFFVFYTVFSYRLCLGEGRKGVQGGASLLWMGPDAGLAGSAVPETRKCFEAHPQDLLFVFRL